eukprot:gene792-1537_t
MKSRGLRYRKEYVRQLQRGRMAKAAERYTFSKDTFYSSKIVMSVSNDFKDVSCLLSTASMKIRRPMYPVKGVSIKVMEPELFNATGSKLATLQEFILNSERKRIKHFESCREKNEKKILQIEADMAQKKKDILRRHLMESAMAMTNKLAVIGDEFGFREAAKEVEFVNARDGVNGRTALQDAAASGHPFLLRALCREYNADTEKRTALGRATALHVAVSNGHRPTCYSLIQQGADVHCKDKFGCTPVFYANNRGVLKLLISKKASVLEKNYAGLMPLQHYLKATSLAQQDSRLIAYFTECETEERKRVFSTDLDAFREITAKAFDSNDSVVSSPMSTKSSDTTISKLKKLRKNNSSPETVKLILPSSASTNLLRIKSS